MRAVQFADSTDDQKVCGSLKLIVHNPLYTEAVPRQNSGSIDLHPFNNVTGLLRKLLISKSVVILARYTLLLGFLLYFW